MERMDHAPRKGGRLDQPSRSDRPRSIPPRLVLRDPGTFQPPLTEPERALIDILDASLTAEWTVFIRPQIGTAQPVAVVFSPYRGLVLLGLVDDDHDANEVLGRLRRMRDELAFVLVPQLGEWLDREGADDTVWVATISARAVVEGRLDPALIDVITDAPVEFDFQFTAALERLLGDRWIEPRAPMPFHPNADQQDLLAPRSGYHLIRGMAGSGKSLVLAYRAAAVAQTGRRVLIATYNRTLVNYLDHLLDTVPIRYRRRLVTVTHFHGLCDEIAGRAGVHLPRAGTNGTTKDRRAVFDEEWPAIALECLDPELADEFGYDACFIDDAQDFLDPWFAVIERLARKPKEIVAAVDDAQNLYGRRPSFYPKLRGARGRWTTYPLMKTPRLTSPTKAAVGQLMGQMELDLPYPEHGSGGERSDRPGRSQLWRVVSRSEAGVKAIDLVLSALRAGVPASDVAVLVPTRQVGAAVSALLGELGVEANHIFPLVPRATDEQSLGYSSAEIEPIVRSRKRAFTWGDPRVKVVTIHSFKGWEAPRVICILPGLPEPLESVSAYVGMTRSSQDLHVITTNDVVNLRDSMPLVEAQPGDHELVHRFGELHDAAEGFSSPFRRSRATEDPGVEWGGMNVRPATSQ